MKDIRNAVVRPGCDLCNVAPVHDVSAKPTSADDGALLGEGVASICVWEAKLKET